MQLRLFKKRSEKKGIELDMLGWFIIALIILIILIILIAIWKEKMFNGIKFIINLFRFRS
ncbi:MAG: hypothetical protein QXW97_01870 [Candidatus Pacearchaeota archaeon]